MLSEPEAKCVCVCVVTLRRVSEFRGHQRDTGRDLPCHAVIVIVMLMERKETGKLAS